MKNHFAKLKKYFILRNNLTVYRKYLLHDKNKETNEFGVSLLTLCGTLNEIIMRLRLHIVTSVPERVNELIIKLLKIKIVILDAYVSLNKLSFGIAKCGFESLLRLKCLQLFKP